MAKPWLGKVGALFHYMHSLPMDMKRGCIGILIHPLFYNIKSISAQINQEQNGNQDSYYKFDSSSSDNALVSFIHKQSGNCYDN